MLVLIIILSLLSPQVLPTPLFWNFVKVSANLSSLYSGLKAYTNSGRTPIPFPLANSSGSTYLSDSWMDPCYTRFNEFSEKLILYWLIQENMYCETVTYSKYGNNTATYAEKYLVRVEKLGTRCP